jgi:hypothetical protein
VGAERATELTRTNHDAPGPRRTMGRAISGLKLETAAARCTVQQAGNASYSARLICEDASRIGMLLSMLSPQSLQESKFRRFWAKSHPHLPG